MIINHNCCIKLVPLVIFIYDARSHIHQMNIHDRLKFHKNMSSECLVFPRGRTDIKKLLDHHQVEQNRHSTYNVTLRRVRATTVAVEKQ